MQTTRRRSVPIWASVAASTNGATIDGGDRVNLRRGASPDRPPPSRTGAARQAPGRERRRGLGDARRCRKASRPSNARRGAIDDEDAVGCRWRRFSMPVTLAAVGDRKAAAGNLERAGEPRLLDRSVGRWTRAWMEPVGRRRLGCAGRAPRF